MLADCPDQAADRVYGALTQVGAAAPPVKCLRKAFRATMDELKQTNEYLQAVACQEALFQAVVSAEAHLADSLRLIRDRYEGGTPLV